MKNLIFILTMLMLFSCAAYKNTNAQHISDQNRVIITDTDTLTVQQDSVEIAFYTDDYFKENEKFYNKENRGEIMRAMEYKITLSPETLKMIEEDGGMRNVLKNILSKKKSDRLRYNIPLRLYAILSLEDLSVSEYKISIYTEIAAGSSLLSLSDNEITKLFAYCKKMRFIYKGTEFKDEIVPVGWTFVMRK